MERDPQAHWLETETALHYARAAVRVGLWASERVLIERHLPIPCQIGKKRLF